VCAALEGTVLFTAFISSLYSRSELVDKYKSILAITSGFGIASIVLYIK
jgi:hypothetical protein